MSLIRSCISIRPRALHKDRGNIYVCLAIKQNVQPKTGEISEDSLFFILKAAKNSHSRINYKKKYPE